MIGKTVEKIVQDSEAKRRRMDRRMSRVVGDEEEVQTVVRGRLAVPLTTIEAIESVHQVMLDKVHPEVPRNMENMLWRWVLAVKYKTTTITPTLKQSFTWEVLG